MKTRLQDLLDKETLKKLTETKKIVKEANPDGTISKDEEKKRAKLVQDTARDIKKIIVKAKKEADKIGGTFRGIGIRHQIHKEVKEIVNHLVRS